MFYLHMSVGPFPPVWLDVPVFGSPFNNGAQRNTLAIGGLTSSFQVITGRVVRLTIPRKRSYSQFPRFDSVLPKQLNMPY